VSRVYLVCGVAGCGKSWVCNQLMHIVKYVPYDRDGHVYPTEEVELHDRTVHVVTTISRWRSIGIDVVPIFILGDFLKVKKHLLDRGGKITKSLYSRWKRMNRLNAKWGVFAGDSDEVLAFLKRELKRLNISKY
jgi:hypothetical protein